LTRRPFFCYLFVITLFFCFFLHLRPKENAFLPALPSALCFFFWGFLGFPEAWGFSQTSGLSINFQYIRSALFDFPGILPQGGFCWTLTIEALSFYTFPPSFSYPPTFPNQLFLAFPFFFPTPLPPAFGNLTTFRCLGQVCPIFELRLRSHDANEVSRSPFKGQKGTFPFLQLFLTN